MLFLKHYSASSPKIRKARGVPGEFLREEVLHPCSADELRQGTRKAERVRQPRRFASFAEARLEIPLTVEELSDEGLARRHVRVVLDPRAADEVELALHHFLFDALKERWVQLWEAR